MDKKFNHRLIEIASNYFSVGTQFMSCLPLLLDSLNWSGSDRQYAEAIPYGHDSMDCILFCETMQNLNYHCDSLEMSLAELDDRLLPCLFVIDDVPYIIRKEAKERQIVSSTMEEIDDVDQLKSGRVFIFRSQEQLFADENVSVSWFNKAISPYKSILFKSLGIVFIYNVLITATPLFIMLLYNNVITSGSYMTLSSLMFGLVIAWIGIYNLQNIRTQLFARISTVLDSYICNAVLNQVLHLPLKYSNSSSIGARMSRLKEFDKIREFISGQFVTTILELPFVLLLLVVISLLNVWLAIIPSLMVMLSIAIMWVSKGRIGRLISYVDQVNTDRQNIIIESLSKMNVLKYCCVEITWGQKVKEIRAQAGIANFKLNFLSAVIASLYELLFYITGALILMVGTLFVLHGELSPGALIACMLLSWRVLSPVKALFASTQRLSQIFTSVNHINQLMDLDSEFVTEMVDSGQEYARGQIEFKNVSFRYQNTSEAALLNINFLIKPRQFVILLGSHGSGKSTLFKLILSLYQQQVGTISIDNKNTSQINPLDLRKMIAFLPQNSELFSGTLKENILLAKPQATDHEINELLRLLEIEETIKQLPYGLDTKLSTDAKELSESAIQAIHLVCLLLKESPIMLLDEPLNHCDNKTASLFINRLTMLKNTKTIILIAHSKLFLSIADQIIYLERGRIIEQGPPAQIMTKLPKEFL